MRKIASLENTSNATWLSARAEARGQIAAERLLDDDPPPAGQAGGSQAADDRGKQRGWNGEVEGRALRAVQRTPERLEGGGVLVVAIDVLQDRQQAVQRTLVDVGAVPLHAFPRVRAQLLDAPRR